MEEKASAENLRLSSRADLQRKQQAQLARKGQKDSQKRIKPKDVLRTNQKSWQLSC
jgi:hypothetical protein